MEFKKERQNFLKRKRVAEMQKKNNFNSRVNAGKGKQMPAREPLPLCNKNLMALNFTILAKTFAIDAGSQNTIPKTVTLGNY